MMMQRLQPQSDELLAELLLWTDALARQHPGGPQAWFEDCAERWFLALLELDPGNPVAQVFATQIAR